MQINEIFDKLPKTKKAKEVKKPELVKKFFVYRITRGKRAYSAQFWTTNKKTIMLKINYKLVDVQFKSLREAEKFNSKQLREWEDSLIFK